MNLRESHSNLLTVLYTMMPRTCSSMVLPRSRRLRYCVPVSASLQDRDRHNRSSEYTKQTCGYLWSEDPWKQEQLELHRLPIVAPRTWSSESWWRSRRPLQSQLLRPSLSLPSARVIDQLEYRWQRFTSILLSTYKGVFFKWVSPEFA